MSEFKWHLMAEEVPEFGMREYLVMGPKGGLKLAHGYVMGHDGPLGAYFKTSVGGYDFIDARKVHAWAEIPPLGSDDTCHDVGDERIFHCSECGFGLSDVYLSDEDYFLDDDGKEIELWPPFCPNCGRRVVQP